MMTSSHLYADEVERITNYRSHIAVHRNGNLIITETIKVISAGEKIQRGIFRTFPTKYKDRYGNRIQVKFEILNITRDGNPESYHIENASNGVKIYIGSSDVYLTPKEYTYTIVYQTSRQLGFFKDFDELYWNVTGTDWDFTIEHAEAVVELPPGARIINKIAYTGGHGEQGRDYTIDYQGSRQIKFTTTSPLMPGQGLTIAVSWQKGIIRELSTKEKLGFFFSDNQNTLAALLGALILLVYYIQVWVLVGKDPEKGVIYPQFAPPTGFSPAATRFVLKMGYSDRVFSAAIVNMAVKGYLKIKEQDDEFVLIRTSSNDSDLSAGEKNIAQKLFGSRDRIELKQKNQVTIQSAISALKSSLKRDFEKLHFLRNSNYLIPGIIITLLTLAAVIFISRDRTGAITMSFWITGWTIGTAVLVYTTIKAWQNAFAAHGAGLFKKGAAVFITFFTLPFVGFEIFGLFAFSNLTSPLTGFLVIILIVIDIIFYRLLKAPTILGRKMMDQIEGFKMYLATAEEDRLNLINPPEKTPELFEKLLPYALALDVENAWADKFTDVLAQATRDATTSYSPAWYSGRDWNSIGVRGIASTLGSSLSSAISSSTTAPGSSSGSGGGGFSGGGGGGGGGGGW